MVFRKFAAPVVYSPSDEADKYFSNQDDIVELIRETSSNLIEEITRDNIRAQVLKRRIPLVIMWVNKNKPNVSEELEVFRRVATKFHKKLAFYIADG